MSKPKHLLDVNVLVALADQDHTLRKAALGWFSTPGLDWGLCVFSEAGFLRVATNPKGGGQSVEAASAVLADLKRHPGYRFWPVEADWAGLTTPFRERVFGHQQITDAYLLGLAVHERGVLVSFDKAIKHLAGPNLAKHVLILA